MRGPSNTNQRCADSVGAMPLNRMAAHTMIYEAMRSMGATVRVRLVWMTLTSPVGHAALSAFLVLSSHTEMWLGVGRWPEDVGRRDHPEDH